MTAYQVSYCSSSADENPKREWVRIGNELSSKRKALNIANKKSLKHFETEVIGINDGDIVHHSYHKKGRLQIQIV